MTREFLTNIARDNGFADYMNIKLALHTMPQDIINICALVIIRDFAAKMAEYNVRNYIDIITTNGDLRDFGIKSPQFMYIFMAADKSFRANHFRGKGRPLSKVFRFDYFQDNWYVEIDSAYVHLYCYNIHNHRAVLEYLVRAMVNHGYTIDEWGITIND